MRLAPQAAHSFAEGLEAILQHSLTRLQVSALLRDLRWLCGNEGNLLLRHRSDDERGEDDLWERLDEVAFHTGLADRGDEVLELVLSYMSILSLM